MKPWTTAFARLTGRAVTPPDDTKAKADADALAASAHGWGAEAALNETLTAAYAANGDDPVKFAAAIGEAKKAYVGSLAGETADRAVLTRLSEEFDRRAAPYRAGIADRTLLRRGEEATKAAIRLTTSYDSITDAARLASGRSDGEKAVAATIDRAKAQIAAMAAIGALDAPGKAAALRRVDNAAVKGAALAEFQLLDPDQQKAFAAGVVDAWASGKGPIARLDQASAQALAADLAAAAESAAIERDKAARATETRERYGNAELATQGLELVGKGQLTAAWLDAHRNDLPHVAATALQRVLEPGRPAKADPAALAALTRRADAGQAIGDALATEIAAGNVPIDDAQRLASLPATPRDRDARWRFDAALKPADAAPAAEHADHWRDVTALDDWLRKNADADDRVVAAKVEGFTADARNRRVAGKRTRLPPPPFARAAEFAPRDYTPAAAATVQLALTGSDLSAAGVAARQLVAWRAHMRETDPSFDPTFALPVIDPGAAPPRWLGPSKKPLGPASAAPRSSVSDVYRHRPNDEVPLPRGDPVPRKSAEKISPVEASEAEYDQLAEKGRAMTAEEKQRFKTLARRLGYTDDWGDGPNADPRGGDDKAGVKKP